MELDKSWLLNEQVTLHQPTKGYRAGLDAVLLAAALRTTDRDEHILEAGCGAGAALLCAAARIPRVKFTGLERDDAIRSLAEENISLNRLDDRLEVVSGDVAERTDAILNRFDQVFSNPPFFRPEAVQEVHAGKAGAYLADVSLEDWLKFMLHAVKPRGRVTLIHRAADLAGILSFMDSRFGEIEVLPVRPQTGKPAKRILITARKGLRKGEVVLHDGLVLYDAPEKLSARMRAIQAGEELSWR